MTRPDTDPPNTHSAPHQRLIELFDSTNWYGQNSFSGTWTTLPQRCLPENLLTVEKNILWSAVQSHNSVSPHPVLSSFVYTSSKNKSLFCLTFDAPADLWVSWNFLLLHQSLSSITIIFLNKFSHTNIWICFFLIEPIVIIWESSILTSRNIKKLSILSDTTFYLVLSNIYTFTRLWSSYRQKSWCF